MGFLYRLGAVNVETEWFAEQREHVEEVPRVQVVITGGADFTGSHPTQHLVGRCHKTAYVVDILLYVLECYWRGPKTLGPGDLLCGCAIRRCAKIF